MASATPPNQAWVGAITYIWTAEDRRSQYASQEYRAVLSLYGAACSMSAAGNRYDNAVAGRSARAKRGMVTCSSW